MGRGVRHLKMAELSSATGFPASTIRYYLRLGLLPDPIRTGSTMAYYGNEHRDRLMQIKRRLKAGATLRDLRAEIAECALMSPSDLPTVTDDQPLRSSQRVRLMEAGSTVFLRSGFEASSVEQVLVQARVSKGAFYSLFAGKQELLAAIVDYELDWYEEVLGRGEPSIERLMTRPDLYRHRRLRVLISLFALLRQAVVSHDDDGALARARARLREPLESDLRAAREVGVVCIDDERLFAEMLLSSAEHILGRATESSSQHLPSTIRRGWQFVLMGAGRA